jgi:biopolymer transport protein ExbD
MRRRRIIPEQIMLTRVNVTPIIDVALVLVIILLVTAPMLSIADLPVNLPAARTRGAEGERNVSISLAATGEVAVDQDIILPALLEATLRKRLAEPGNEEVLVVVRADSGAPHGLVRQVLEDARAAGAVRLAIATLQEAKAER